MNNFFRLIKLNIRISLKNKFAIFFAILSSVSILLTFYLQIHPYISPIKKLNQEKFKEKDFNSSKEIKDFNSSKEIKDFNSSKEIKDFNSSKVKFNTIKNSNSSIKINQATKNEMKKNKIFYFLTYRFFISFVLMLSLAFLGSKIIQDEAELGTIQLLFSRPMFKTTIYISKFIAMSLSTVIIILPTFAISFIILFLPNFYFINLIYLCAALMLASFAYSSIFLLIGNFRGAIYISLAYSIFWEISITQMVERIRIFSVTFNAKCIINDILTPNSNQVGNIPAIEASIFLLLIISFVLLGGILVFRKREFFYPS